MYIFRPLSDESLVLFAIHGPYQQHTISSDRLKMKLDVCIVFFLLALLSCALANGEPELTRREKEIYSGFMQDYRLLYNPWRGNVNGVRYYDHLVRAHPTLERDALGFAHRAGKGPYQAEMHGGKLYVATIVRGNEGPGMRWGLRQTGGSHYDAHLFWRIDASGAKLLRFNIWPAGAQANQVMTMQDALERFRARGV